MNKQETARVESAIDYLERCLQWIKSDRVEVCYVGIAPPGIAYTNKDGRQLQVLCKDAGSDLQLAEHALEGLRKLRDTRGFDALKASQAEPAIA